MLIRKSLSIYLPFFCRTQIFLVQKNRPVFPRGGFNFISLNVQWTSMDFSYLALGQIFEETRERAY